MPKNASIYKFELLLCYLNVIIKIKVLFQLTASRKSLSFTLVIICLQTCIYWSNLDLRVWIEDAQSTGSVFVSIVAKSQIKEK